MIKELLYKRTSTRLFSGKKISKDTIEDILEAGRLAPSGSNEQPWIFGVIDDPEIIESIAGIAYKQNFIKSAQVVIALCTENISQEAGGRDVIKARYPDLAPAIDEVDEAVFAAVYAEAHQVKIPCSFMILQAQEHGIGTTWVSYFDVMAMNQLLGVPSEYHVTDLLVMGYPSEDIKPRDKKILKNITFYNKYEG